MATDSFLSQLFDPFVNEILEEKQKKKEILFSFYYVNRQIHFSKQQQHWFTKLYETL